MDLNLSGKRVLITGSSRGIGKIIAKNFKHEEALVILNGTDSENLKYTANELNISNYIQGDVTDPFEAKKIVSECINLFGGLDILICNVGSGESVPPGQENYDEWLKSFKTNFLSATNLVEASLEHLSKTKGVIVCISSICGLEVIKDAPITYSISKSALNMYVKGISKPLGEKGIRINAIAPGNINFEGSVWHKKVNSEPSSVYQMLNNEVALKKLGSPEDIASLATYLSSSISNFITGSIFKVDGGQLKS